MLKYLWVVCLLAQSCSLAQPPVQAPVNTVVITVEGQAPINKGMPLLAKKQALQDAIRQASMQSSVNVQGRTLVNQNSIATDTFSMQTAAAVSSSRIIKEWQADNMYHVVATVELSSDGTCAPLQRKRIIATAFPLAKQEQVSGYETQDLYSGIPRELNNILMESGEFIGTNATHINLYPRPELAPELQDSIAYRPSKVMQMAAANGVQFVLSGVIRDMEVESSEYMRGAGPLALARSLARGIVARRGIGIDVFVHDGFTGALLFQQRYVESAVGDVWIPATYTVGSERFNATSSGEKIANIISQASSDLRRTLSCYPFATRITDIKGDKVFLDAGAQERLNVGDQLMAYAASGDDLTLDGGLNFIGKDKQPVGVVTIDNITPRYAIGHLEVPARELGVRVGDWVRSY
ncbi:MAG: flagellar assembly protein T N-terminal domain-containing protein [Methylobacter sp.]|nr:flagellar assembly protein T N-terminal domain-containing protein [Methylobacter sp.]